MRDPARPEHLAPGYDSGDHLHPNDAGYEAMAAAIDLRMFGLALLSGGCGGEARDQGHADRVGIRRSLAVPRIQAIDQSLDGLLALPRHVPAAQSPPGARMRMEAERVIRRPQIEMSVLFAQCIDQRLGGRRRGPRSAREPAQRS